MNGIGPIKESTRQKVLDAAKQLDYYPNDVARRFAKKQSGNIGVVLPFVPKVNLFSTFYFSEILSGIGEMLHESEYDLLLLFRDADGPKDYSRWFKTGKVDGLIILGSSDSQEERNALLQLADHHVPFCLVNQRYDEEKLSYVDGEHVSGSREMTAYLIQQGCRRIAFLNGPLAYSNSRDRLLGYRQALEEHGIEWNDQYLFYGNYSRKSGAQQAELILKLLPKLDAVYAANDRMAIGVMQTLKQAGIRPGHDLLVAGYDNSDASSVSDPPLTTVHVPFHLMGREAAKYLLRQFGCKEQPEIIQLKLDTKLIIRASTTKN
ncbi:LacI family DNA-binding transcriptional regulator [Marinicrinis lubricantis]